MPVKWITAKLGGNPLLSDSNISCDIGGTYWYVSSRMLNREMDKERLRINSQDEVNWLLDIQHPIPCTIIKTLTNYHSSESTAGNETLGTFIHSD